MPLFNWNQLLLGTPPEWAATEGKGVKIAIIDSGADLGHPSLAHLALLSRNRFDAAQPDLDPKPELLTGAYDVADAAVRGIPHGTYCTSVIGAQAVPEHLHGVKGIAPQAEIVIIKATDAQNTSRNDYFLNALQIAIQEKVDLISVSMVPTDVRDSQQERIDALFKALEAAKIGLFVALDNTHRLDVLKNLRFPALRPEAILVGVLTSRMLQNLPPNPDFGPIHWMMPPVPVRFCDQNTNQTDPYVNDIVSASIANACLSGVAALFLSHCKQIEGDAYQPRDKTALETALSVISVRLVPNQLLQNPVLQFVSPAAVST